MDKGFIIIIKKMKDMKGIGKMILNKEVENFIFKMEMFMRVNLKMIKFKVMGF